MDEFQRLKDQINIHGHKPIRGVNLGGWLLAEYWMTKESPAWRGVPENRAEQGEYQAMKYLGHEKGDAQFDAHRRTFITETDFAQISAYGLNTVRIPIGYWIREAGDGEDRTWAPGGITYLDRAIREWGPKHKLFVLISIHAARGSQNGWDSSSPQEFLKTNWDKHQENIDDTVALANWLALRYNDDICFLGIGLLNEPNKVDPDKLTRYYLEAGARIREHSDMCMIGVAPLLNQQEPGGTEHWEKFMNYPKWARIRHEWHKSMIWGYENYDADEIIKLVQTDVAQHFVKWDIDGGNWLLVSEWSLAAAVPMNEEQMRRFAKAQLAAYKKARGGWIFWTWKFYGEDEGGTNPWSAKEMFRNGFLPRIDLDSE
ncbi:unnamed protein product, partial [Mesorhabditis spiculigera]